MSKGKDRDYFVQFFQNVQIGIRFLRTSDVACADTVTLSGFKKNAHIYWVESCHPFGIICACSML